MPFGGIPLLGQERGNIEVLAALKSAGCEVHCLVRGESWAEDVRNALSQHGISWSVIPYMDAWRPGAPLSVLIRNVWAFLGANLRFINVCRTFRPTHIHGFNTQYLLNVLAGVALTRAPMVFRAGDSPATHNALARTLWRFTMLRSSRVVAISDFIANRLVALGVPPPKISVIYNRPPTRSAVPDEALPDLSLQVGEFRIVYVGQIIEAKGIHLLIDAFGRLAQRHDKVRLIVAGRISAWEGDAWARALRERVGLDANLADRVLFTGYVEQVPALLSNCDVLAVPSLVEEALGNVVIEAKSMGVPAVVFPRGGLPELIAHEEDGLVCAAPTTEALEEALERCVVDTDLLATMQQNSVQSLERLGTRDFSARWRAVYEEARERRRQ